MEEHKVKVLELTPVTHDVRRVRVEKPEGYIFKPGQATEVTINKEGWTDKRNPFTFTSLNEDPYLEFTIKMYPDHHGVTEQIGKLEVGDELILHDVWGAITYKGPGTFIAGGAGVTPFLAILKELEKTHNTEGNQLLFANKTEGDIICKEDLKKILGNNFHNILSQEENPSYDHGYISKDYLADKIGGFNQNFYICGPDPMIAAMQGYLKELGYEDSLITVEV